MEIIITSSRKVDLDFDTITIMSQISSKSRELQSLFYSYNVEKYIVIIKISKQTTRL